MIFLFSFLYAYGYPNWFLLVDSVSPIRLGCDSLGMRWDRGGNATTRQRPVAVTVTVGALAPFVSGDVRWRLC